MDDLTIRRVRELRKKRIESVRELRELDQLIKDIEETCMHEWSDPFFDPIRVVEPKYKIAYQGSDAHPGLDGFEEVQKDSWTRICNECGKEEHTTELRSTAAVVPNFKSDKSNRA